MLIDFAKNRLTISLIMATIIKMTAIIVYNFNLRFYILLVGNLKASINSSILRLNQE